MSTEKRNKEKNCTENGPAIATPQNTWLSLVLPIIVLICAYCLPDWTQGPGAGLPHSQDEARLQEVALLMGQIYTTLANMTFIPPEAIRQGPHYINTTAMPCAFDSSIVHLMKTMPYVDSLDLGEENDPDVSEWLFGGRFIDYRQQSHVEAACDEVYIEELELLLPIVPLTLPRGTGLGRDSSLVLFYDVQRHAICASYGESRWNRGRRQPSGAEHPIAVIFDGNVQSAALSSTHVTTSMDAATILERILRAYETLQWIPWDMSGRKDDHSLKAETIRDLLRHNGWPQAFNPDRFNADMIHASYRRSARYGPAASLCEKVASLQGDENQDGTILDYQKKIDDLQNQIADMDGGGFEKQQRWLLEFRAQSRRWSLKEQRDTLKNAQKEVDRVCPDCACTSAEDEILWEFYHLERAYGKLQHGSSPEKQCDLEVGGYSDSSIDPIKYQNCLARRKRGATWLRLAYDQSKSECERYCATTGCALIPQPSLGDRLKFMIKADEAEIARLRARSIVMYDWLPILPEDAEMARMYFEVEASAVANGPWYIEENLEYLRDLLAQGKLVELRRQLDDDGH